MTVFGPTTDAERHGLQVRAYAVLGDLLTLDLPPMRWELSPLGALVGRVTVQNPAGQRAAFEAWTAYLGATPWAERVEGNTTYLRAVVERWEGVGIAIFADIVDEADESP